MSKYETFALSLLRILAGFTYLLHGVQLLFGAFGGAGGSHAPAAMMSLLWIAGLLEFLGGSLTLLGLFTRPVAFLMCGQMAVGYFMKHVPAGFWPITNGGELAILYCFIFLYLFAAGGGPWSLDRLLRKRPRVTLINGRSEVHAHK
jgi:putative oxidoreductase